MARRIGGVLICALSLCFLFSTAARAHHSFTAEFDIYQPVILNHATITKTDWINPHCQIYVDVKDESGKTQTWKIESWGTGNLHRAGLSRELLAPGTVVNMRGYKAKDGSNMAYLRNIEFADGTKFELWIGGANGNADAQRN
jgi:hypothetical protein